MKVLPPHRHGTWAVSALPLGGYVKMQDDPPPGASPSEIASAFNTQPVGKRIAIVAAGPIFNLILAVLLYAVLNLAGTQEPAAIQAGRGYAGGRAGLLEGDRILSIGGEEVISWADARWRLMDVMSGGGRALVEVSTASGAVHQRELTLPANAMDPPEATRWRPPARWPSRVPPSAASSRAGRARRPA